MKVRIKSDKTKIISVNRVGIGEVFARQATALEVYMRVQPINPATHLVAVNLNTGSLQTFPHEQPVIPMRGSAEFNFERENS